MEKQVLLHFVFFFSINLLPAQPNFVIILTDDMGWTGTSVEMDTSIANGGSKSDYYLTPGLDTFATQAMIFSQAYSPAPKCAPSRNSILTGKTPARTNYTEVSSQVDSSKILLAPILDNQLNGADTIIPEWLKNTGLGYQTAHFGKWHIGGGASRPNQNGFDASDGNTSNNDGDTGGGAQPDPKTMFDLTTRSKAFIQSAVDDGDPFYMQVSHYAVHASFEYLQTTFNDYDTVSVGTNHDSKAYAANTTDSDSAIWVLYKFIDSLQLDTNTYVVVMSDNGSGSGTSSNTPLQRGKSFIWEGGIRTPFLIRGPGIAPGTYCHEPIAQWDLYKTIAELVGTNTQLPDSLDGESIVPLIHSGAGTFSRELPLVFHSPHYSGNSKELRSAIVEGDYKLYANYDTGVFALYDLKNDIGETTDLTPSQPELSREMTIKLREYMRVSNAKFPRINQDSFPGSAPDADLDGLDDEWEFQELLSYHFNGIDDPDNDGLDNENEETNGTDPYTPQALVSIKVFLEGNYSVSMMNDDLRQANLLPTDEPYSALGFGGTGEESIDLTVLGTTGNDAIVDWIFIELRDKSNSSIVLKSRSALLQRDGDVVDLDGVSPVDFGVQADDYFIAVRHRNHLGVMSLNTFSLSGNNSAIDFSTIPTFGTAAQKDLGSGVYGLWSADTDSSGAIDNSDRTSTWTGKNNIMIYSADDVNLDGKTDSSDRRLTWNNRGTSEQLP